MKQVGFAPITVIIIIVILLTLLAGGYFLISSKVLVTPAPKGQTESFTVPEKVSSPAGVIPGFSEEESKKIQEESKKNIEQLPKDNSVLPVLD